MASYRFASRPSEGEAIAFEQNALKVPDDPIVPFIEGDGTGPDIWRATRRVFDAAVEKVYGGKRQDRVVRGLRRREGASTQHGEWLPQETLDAISDYRVSHQGPAHDAGRRRHPLAERHAAPGARPLRLRPPGALLRGRAVARCKEPREGQHGHLPREHRGRVRGHRVEGRARRKPTKLRRLSSIERVRARRSARTRRSASSRCREFGSKRLVRMAIRYAIEHEPHVGHARAQGQHHEVHRGRLPRLGLRARASESSATRPSPKPSCRRRRSCRAARSSSRTASPTRCSSRSCCGPTSTR